MHRDVSSRLGNRVALRYPKDGLYHDVSWNDYRFQADQAASGLIELGIEPGDRVSILSENRVEWFVADHAILSTAAADVPLHAPLAPKQVAYQVGHSEARAIIVSNQVQADKVFAVLSDLPLLEIMISFEPIICRDDRIRCLSWQGLKHLTRVNHNEIKRRESAIGADSLATIIYTSGTTGNPKGVMLSHMNLLHNARETGVISYLEDWDVLLSWLPYSHIYARTVDHYLTSIAGITVALAESVDTLFDNLKQIQPTWLTSVPRVYEKVWSSISELSADERQTAIRKVFGTRMRQLTSGGAPLPKYIAEGFFEAGLPLLEGYGLTESAPVIAFNNMLDYRIGSVGHCIADVEVRIADDGEICARGPNIMQGYWRNPEATAETIIDGWLQTGDVGRVDADGFLFITDRKKDLFVTSAGKNIAPAELERLLGRDEYIDQAVVYGDGRKFVSALVVPNFEKLSELVGSDNSCVDTNEDFITNPSIMLAYEERIAAIMEQVSQPERVKRFLLLSRPFQVDDDELTATLKVRRRHIISKYEAHLAGLYE
jgi:long-chain acyl-CoA synthetase